MNLIKPAAAVLAIGMAATTFVPTADARSRHHHNNGAFFAGAAGFAAGALLGSLAQPRYRCGYYDDCYAPRYSRSYYQPRHSGYYYDEPRYYRPEPIYIAPQPRVYYQQPAYVYQQPYDSCGQTGVSRPATSMC